MNVQTDALNLAREGLEAGLRVSHIATFPLSGCAADAEIAEVLANPSLLDFDHIPVERDDLVVGVLARADVRPFGSVHNQMRQLDSSMLVSSQETLTKFIELMGERRYLLVVRDTGITGIVTRSDLLKLPVRLYAFSLIAHLELLMAQLIRTAYPNEADWRNHLAPHNRQRLKGTEKRARTSRVNPDPLELTYFDDKTQVVRHYIAQSGRFTNEQRDEFDADAKFMKDLRDSVGHHRDFGDETGLRAFLLNIGRARLWIVRLQPCLDGRSLVSATNRGSSGHEGSGDVDRRMTTGQA